MVKLLQAHKITPVIVFDGASLPMKASTNQTRRASREHNLNKGKTHFEAGQFREADECFQRAVKVTSKMCRALQLELNRMSIEFIVAPYEGAYLNKQLYLNQSVSFFFFVWGFS
jgi:exonuclease-1